MKWNHENIQNEILEIRDNKGETIDRYTIVLRSLSGTYNCGIELNDAIGQDENVNSFDQYGTARPGEHLGVLIAWDDLPNRNQNALLFRYNTSCDRPNTEYLAKGEK